MKINQAAFQAFRLRYRPCFHLEMLAKESGCSITCVRDHFYNYHRNKKDPRPKTIAKFKKGLFKLGCSRAELDAIFNVIGS